MSQFFVASSGGSGPTTPQQGASLALIQSQTASASASIIFTAIPVFPVYFVLIAGLRPTAGSPALNLDFSQNAGSTWVNSAMSTGINVNNYDSTTLTNSNSVVTGIICPAISSIATYNASFYINNLNVVGSSATYYGSAEWYNGATFQFGNLLGSTGPATNINAIRFILSAGTIATGTISLYGIKTS